MQLIISIAVGLITLIIGNLIALVLSLLVGLIVEPIAEKILAELSLKRFRHVWSYAWIGFTVGAINAGSIYFFEINGIVLLLVFLIYLIFFMRHKTEFVLHQLCNGDPNQFKRLSRRTEITTFLCYLIAVFGLWTMMQTKS